MNNWHYAVKLIVICIAIISIIAFLRGFVEEVIKDRVFWKQLIKDIKSHF